MNSLAQIKPYWDFFYFIWPTWYGLWWNSKTYLEIECFFIKFYFKKQFSFLLTQETKTNEAGRRINSMKLQVNFLLSSMSKPTQWLSLSFLVSFHKLTVTWYSKFIWSFSYHFVILFIRVLLGFGLMKSVFTKYQSLA